MDGKEILQKYRPVIHEMIRDLEKNNISYMTIIAYPSYCIGMSEKAQYTIFNGSERIEEVWK